MKTTAFMYKGKSVIITYKNLIYTLEYNGMKTKHLSKKGCFKFLESKND